jgi:hypothetical protein
MSDAPDGWVEVGGPYRDSRRDRALLSSTKATVERAGLATAVVYRAMSTARHCGWYLYSEPRRWRGCDHDDWLLWRRLDGHKVWTEPKTELEVGNRAFERLLKAGLVERKVWSDGADRTTLYRAKPGARWGQRAR